MTTEPKTEEQQTDPDVEASIAELMVKWREENVPAEDPQAFDDRNQAMLAAKMREKLRLGDFPKRAIAALKDMHGPGIEKAKELARSINRDALLILTGPRGTGKTQMATWLASRISRCSCRYVRALNLFDHFKASFDRAGKDAESERAVATLYRTPSLLVIDELHQRLGRDWEQNRLINLIDTRYGDMNTTILITNQTAEEAERELGDSVWQRIAETGGVVECNWKSYRLP